MNLIWQRLRVSFVAAAILFTILSFFLVHQMTSAAEVKCKNYFTNCTDGGCDASEGWKAEACIIRCGPAGSEEILCMAPMN